MQLTLSFLLFCHGKHMGRFLYHWYQVKVSIVQHIYLVVLCQQNSTKQIFQLLF